MTKLKMFCLGLTIYFTQGLIYAQQTKTYDIFSYTAPRGFTYKKTEPALFYEKKDSKSYCQLFLYPAITSEGRPQMDFEKNWNAFARNADQGVGDPETHEADTIGNWQVIMGAARGQFNKKMFALTLTTISNGTISYYTAAVFTDQKYATPIQEFIGSIIPDTGLFKGNIIAVTNPQHPTLSNKDKPVTRFDDGWIATPENDFVKIVKENTEVRLLYINNVLDDARPNTVDAQEYYWSQYVVPYFQIAETEKWSGVEYPVIYFMQGSGTDKATGQPCHVALKVVYNNGARPIVVITRDKQQYQQQYPHPNNLDQMLNYNKFALTPAQVTGKWTGGSGAGLQYYNVYTGDYAGMSTISTSDDFQFKPDGTYTSAFRSASTNFGSTRFNAVDYKGKYSITDWTISAGNRHEGKTTLFRAQLIAVKNGFLLYMEDSEYPAMNYTFIKLNK